MHLILPVSGQSSRFPGTRPKWMLTHPNGNLMLLESIRKFDLKNIHSIVVICLRNHYEKFNVEAMLQAQFQKAELSEKLQIVVIEESVSQPHTVYQGIKAAELQGPIFIKDSDNAFTFEPQEGNSICYIRLADAKIRTAANKSYIMMNENGNIVNIVEKHIVSDTFCVGGYSFANAAEFCTSFEKIGVREDGYVSHIIFQMILDGHLFRGREITSFLDWGTLEDWNDYRSRFCTLFIDLDGTLVTNSAEYFPPFWGETDGIAGNIAIINKMYHSGYAEIIITTTRSLEYEEQTRSQLERIGLKYHRLILGLSHCKRIVINDYANSNPYRSCDAINLQRNSNELGSKLAGVVSIGDDRA